MVAAEEAAAAGSLSAPLLASRGTSSTVVGSIITSKIAANDPTTATRAATCVPRWPPSAGPITPPTV